ncbi:SusD family protein [Arachidicoccus rhizosphaerae]|uniref:SusD family protein n=1 Tax=Arachidicoccus rhizosphaerae TaxID=551991 RepID=A0A1H3XZ81_9BACT|nr:RagB/SusD family nutrient uptake outer membrane protein [Arachidicoccus rhizosphaerae]SEA04676.1 SusD family protein [Arachidicoccus rhizosphaerae]
MKYLVIIGMALLTMSSCSKDFLKEDPKSSITPSNFYQSASDLDAAVRGIIVLNNLAWNQTGGLACTFGSDDITTWRGGNKFDISDFDTYQPNSSNAKMIIWWDYFYQVIKSSNQLILKYQDATQATETERNNAAGAAYFFRAMDYFFLTRTWGSVPMPLGVTTDTTSLSTPDEIYTQIVSDLKNAESMLPDAWTGESVVSGYQTLPTTGSAKALLANVYLTMAGWPLKQTDKYALAAEKAGEVIDNASKYGYGLLDSCSYLWDGLHHVNKEIVFGAFYNYVFSWANQNQMGPMNTAAGEEGGWDELFGEISFYNKFPAGPRKDATYQTVYYQNNDHSKAVDYTKLLKAHPYFWKYRETGLLVDPLTHAMSNWESSATMYIIRYPEVLLTYAEAKAMSSGVDQSAYDAINQVRKRAGLEDLQTGLSQTAFRDSVIAERGWEFAGPEPAARWFDLIRTETVAQANKDRSSAEETIVGQPNDETHSFYWAPLPAIM